jgi:hypothetical protein
MLWYTAAFVRNDMVMFGPKSEKGLPNFVTGPPPENTSNLADFQNRHGEAPRFAGKGREIALGRCWWDDTKVVQPDGGGQVRGGRKGETYPHRGSDDPPFKN